MVEEGGDLGSREEVWVPHPGPAVQYLRRVLAEAGPIYLVENTDLSQQALDHVQVPNIAGEILDGHANMVPPSDFPAMLVLRPGDDIEGDSLDADAASHQSPGALAGVLEDDEEVFRLVACGAHFVRRDTGACRQDPGDVPSVDVVVHWPVPRHQQDRPGQEPGDLVHRGGGLNHHRIAGGGPVFRHRRVPHLSLYGRVMLLSRCLSYLLQGREDDAAVDGWDCRLW